MKNVFDDKYYNDNIKRYVCHNCSFTFTSKQNLIKHMQKIDRCNYNRIILNDDFKNIKLKNLPKK